MKSRLDIFRPIAAAAPTLPSATSIFRRSNNRRRLSSSCGRARSSSGSGTNQSDDDDDDDDESFVVSVPPGQWPPHKEALSSTDSVEPLQTSAPLPTSTVSNGEGDADPSSPASVVRANNNNDDDDATRRREVKPSYYRIELDPDDAEGNAVRLTAGDDSSVQFDREEHNLRLKQEGGHRGGEEDEKGIIARASPVGSPPPSRRQRQLRQQPHQWAVSDSGRIVALPPRVDRLSKKKQQQVASDTIDQEQASPTLVLKPAKGNNSSNELSLPPRLVKADSNGSDSSSSLTDDHRGDIEEEDVILQEECISVDIDPESPPRMTRSVASPSLFQDSVGSSSREGSVANDSAGANRGKGGGGASAADSSRKSSSTFDLLGTLLDLFSLSGPCCHQGRRAAGCGGSGAPLDAVVCR